MHGGIRSTSERLRARYFLFVQIYAADQDDVTNMIKDILANECNTLEGITSFVKWLDTKVLDSYEFRDSV